MSQMKVYSTRTLLGNWVEDRRLPSWEGTVPSASTEQQVRNFEATGITVPAYGASLLLRQGQAKAPPSPYAKASASPRAPSPESTRRLEDTRRALGISLQRSPQGAGNSLGGSGRSPAPASLRPEERYDTGNIVAPDRLYPAATWASLQREVHFGADNTRAEDAAEFRPKIGVMGPMGTGTSANADPTMLAEYRRKWINEPEVAVASRRFTPSMMADGANAVAGRYRMGGERFFPGTVKSVSTLVERCQERHGADSVWLLVRSCPRRFTLLQLHAFVQHGPSGPCLASAGGTLDCPLTVDEGKELFRQLALEEPTNADATQALLLASGIGACPTTRDGKLISDPAAAVTGQHATFVRALLWHDKEWATGLNPARQSFVDAAWALALDMAHVGAAAGDAVPLGVLKEVFDATAHPSVKAARGSPPLLTAAQCARRFLDGLAFVLAEEPPAHRAWGRDGGDDGDAEALPGGITPDLLLPQELQGERLPLSQRVSKAHFDRYWRYVSAAVPADAAFQALLAACFHLDEAAAVLVKVPAPGTTAGRAGFAGTMGSTGGLSTLGRSTGPASPGGATARPLVHADLDGKAAWALAADGSQVHGHTDAAATAARAAAVLAESGFLSPGSVKYKTKQADLAAAANKGGRASGAAPPASSSPVPAFSAQALAHVAVLVTHADGRRTMERIPKDRFLRLGSGGGLTRDAESDIRDRLAAQGITDVKAVALDF
jgi:hypothetical protein